MLEGKEEELENKAESIIMAQGESAVCQCFACCVQF